MPYELGDEGEMGESETVDGVGEITFNKPRVNWGPGPWDGEPDRKQWRTASGLPGLLVRGPWGAWCGYVAVAPGHPLHGKTDMDDDVGSLRVHGGVTYTAECRGHICHVPAPGEPDNVWWIGFDCSHYGDLSPDRSNIFPEETSVYRGLAYVEAEVESLASQLEIRGWSR
jgi:hypothetical protein